MNPSQTIKLHEQFDLVDPNASANQAGTPQSRLDGIFQLLNNIVRTDRDFGVKKVLFIDDMEIQLNAGLRFKRTEFSTLVTGSVYSVNRNDYCIGITSLSYAPSVGLPKPSDVGIGKTYLVKDEAGGAATTTITIRSQGEATIDGATSVTIVANYGSKMFYTDGNKWYVGSN